MSYKFKNLFDYKKDTMNKRQIDKKISLIPESVLNSNIIPDQEFLFLIKKTEKIILATYILTDFIPKEETIKKSLKDNSHEALEGVCDFLNSRIDRFDSVRKIKGSFIKLLTQYNLAYVAGYISQMNSQLIKDEVSNLLRIIDDFERELEDEKLPDLKYTHFNVDVRNKRQYKSKNAVKDTNHVKDITNTNVLNKKTVFTEYKKTNTSSNDRDYRILDIIKDKGEVSIKDISDVILDCSEKTIQRTLNKMIKNGKVEKKGERRWARYSLV